MRRIRAPGDLDAPIRHGLHTLPETLQQDNNPTANMTTIGIVGPGGRTRELGQPLTLELLRALRSGYLQCLLPPPATGTFRCHSRRQQKAGKIQMQGVT
ncbi:hypothetical protein V8E53_011137 [Lactarius tabidus]